MGRGIRAFIEYMEPWGEYRSLTQGMLNLIDDDRIFKAIASGNSVQTNVPSVPLRNLPPNDSKDEWESFLVDAREYSDAFDLAGDGPDEDVPGDLGGWRQTKYCNNQLANPDHHLPDWLTLSEFEMSISKAGLVMEDLQPDMRATVTSMRALVRDLGDDQVRLVLRFDA
jgi:hypothetical protein